MRTTHYIFNQTKFAALFSSFCEMIRTDIESLDSEERDFEEERAAFFADLLEGMEYKYQLSPNEIDLMERFHSETHCSPDLAYDYAQDLLNILYRAHVDELSHRLHVV